MLGSTSFEMSTVRELGLPGPLRTEPVDQVQAVTIWPSWGGREVWLLFWIRAIDVDKWLQIQFLWGVKSKMFLKEVNADIAYLSIIYFLYLHSVHSCASGGYPVSQDVSLMNPGTFYPPPSPTCVNLLLENDLVWLNQSVTSAFS